MTKYYFNEYDTDIESLKNRTFTINQLNEVYRDLFEKEIHELGDTETTFESWLNDNIKMSLIYTTEVVEIPKQYSHEYVCCLPFELEKAILNEVARIYKDIDIDDYINIIENVQCEKVTNITETINIEFI